MTNICISNLNEHEEHWASIDGYSNYQVSWWGRVKNTKTDRILKPGLSSSGYLTVGLSKNGKAKSHNIHCLVAREWALNPNGKKCVDHIDNNKQNNHHENLRYATYVENGGNRKKQADASSIYKGVYRNKPMQKWMAYIQCNSKLKCLGYFESEKEAGATYNAAAIVHFVNYAKLNVIED